MQAARPRAACMVNRLLLPDQAVIVGVRSALTIAAIPTTGRFEIPVRLLPEDEKIDGSCIYTKESKVERIKIELSDIYD